MLACLGRHFFFCSILGVRDERPVGSVFASQTTRLVFISGDLVGIDGRSANKYDMGTALRPHAAELSEPSRTSRNDTNCDCDQNSTSSTSRFSETNPRRRRTETIFSEAVVGRRRKKSSSVAGLLRDRFASRSIRTYRFDQSA